MYLTGIITQGLRQDKSRSRGGLLSPVNRGIYSRILPISELTAHFEGVLTHPIGRTTLLHSLLPGLEIIGSIQRFRESGLEQGNTPVMGIKLFIQVAAIDHRDDSDERLYGPTSTHVILPVAPPVALQQALPVEDQNQNLAVRFALTHSELQEIQQWLVDRDPKLVFLDRDVFIEENEAVAKST